MQKEIIKRPEVFSEEYFPSDILHREREIAELKHVLKGAIKGKPIPNGIIYGPTGVGKTTVSKFIIQEFNKSTNKARAMYINAWAKTSRYSILYEIAKNISWETPKTGASSENLVEIIKEGTEEKRLILFIDEGDALIKAEEGAIVYEISRGLLGKTNLLLITNDRNAMIKADERIKTTIMQYMVEFPPYKPKEIKDILIERAKLGLFPETWTEDIIARCAGYASRKGNARMGISLLYSSAIIAEKEGKEKIEIEDVLKAKEKMNAIKGEEKEKKLANIEDKTSKEIIELLYQDKEIKGKEIAKKLKIPERTIRDKLTKLEKIGIIKRKKAPGKGNSWLWFLED